MNFAKVKCFLHNFKLPVSKTSLTHAMKSCVISAQSIYLCLIIWIRLTLTHHGGELGLNLSCNHTTTCFKTSLTHKKEPSVLFKLSNYCTGVAATLPAVNLQIVPLSSLGGHCIITAPRTAAVVHTPQQLKAKLNTSVLIML